MPRYTMRRSWPDKEDDYVFRVDGRDAGRCYFTIAAHNRKAWLWTTYGGNKGGLADTLEDAQLKFKMAIERIR